MSPSPRTAWALATALTATLGASETRAGECTSVVRTGWYHCTEEGDVGAVPHALLDKEAWESDEHVALATCIDAPGWKIWGDPTLSVAFLSGDTGKPQGETVVEVATGSPGTTPHYRSYRAQGTIETEAGEDEAQTRYHRTQVQGEEARALLAHVVEGTERWWLWRNEGQEEPHAIARRTLKGPARAVLEACKGG